LRILLDVDGVCAAFIEHMLAVLKEDFSDEEVPDVKDITMGDFREKLTDNQRDFSNLILDMGSFWRSLPVAEGAQDAVKSMLREGHEVVWVTSPWISCLTWESERREWLAEHFDATHKDVVFCHRKELVIGHILIDDKPQNVTDWQAEFKGGAGLLYDQPWNASSKGAKRFTWKDTDKLLSGIRGPAYPLQAR
jgi:5'(3')-deoxyribonucleotidase